jgi:hypothetical protein
MGKRRKRKGKKKGPSAPSVQMRDPVSEGALANYFSVLQTLSTGTLIPLSRNKDTADALSRLTAIGTAQVREARVFALAPQLYDEIEATVQAEATMRYAMPHLFDYMPELRRAPLEQRVAALPSVMSKLRASEVHGKTAPELPPGVYEAFDAIDVASKRVELPRMETWPFRSMWVGFGKGCQLTPDETLNRHVWANTVSLIAKGPHCAVLLGYLVFDAGEEFGAQVSEVYRVPGHDNPLLCAVYDERSVFDTGSGWLRGGDLTPWVVKTLLELLRESRTSVLEQQPTFRDRQLAERRSERSGVPMPVPRPYYVVRVRRRVVYDKARQVARRRLPSCPWQLRHRFDVVAHERCRVQRGPLPLNPKLRATLEKRRYRIYTLEQPSAEDQARLSSRGLQPKHTQEWLAILTSQVASFQKGPEDGPYVPAIRRAG